MDDSNYFVRDVQYSDSTSDWDIFPPPRKPSKPVSTEHNDVDIDLCNSEPEEPEDTLRSQPLSSRTPAQDALQDERRLKIRQAIARHGASHEFRNQRLEILVSKKMYDDESKNDVLKQLRVVMRHQIYVHDRPLTNLILWRLKSERDSAPSDVPFSLLVFTAAEYIAHIKSNTLDHFCRDLMASASGNKIVIAISDMDRYCKQMARDALKKGGQSLTIISKEAVQDSYAFLFMDYGIRTHDVRNREELSHYICDISRAVANLPHYQNEAFLESIMSYKKRKATRAAGPFFPLRKHRDGVTAAEQNDSQSEHEGGSFLPRLSNSPSHVYSMILSLIPGVSKAKVKAICEKYPTLQCLLNALQNTTNQDDMLSDITFGGTNRRIGRTVSQRVAKVCTSTDPTTEIVP